MNPAAALLLGIYVTIGIVVATAMTAVYYHEYGWHWRLPVRGLFGVFLWPVALYRERRKR